MNTIAVIIIAAIILAITAAVTFSVAVARADDGYENETGFHRGKLPACAFQPRLQRHLVRRAEIVRTKQSSMAEPAVVS